MSYDNKVLLAILKDGNEEKGIMLVLIETDNFK
jgi:hypothetical protein